MTVRINGQEFQGCADTVAQPAAVATGLLSILARVRAIGGMRESP